MQWSADTRYAFHQRYIEGSLQKIIFLTIWTFIHIWWIWYNGVSTVKDKNNIWELLNCHWGIQQYNTHIHQGLIYGPTVWLFHPNENEFPCWVRFFLRFLPTVFFLATITFGLLIRDNLGQKLFRHFFLRFLICFKYGTIMQSCFATINNVKDTLLIKMN